MAYYYLSSTGLSNFELDTNVVNLSFSGIERNYEAVKLFSDGSLIKGNGSIGARTINISQKFKKVYTISGIRYDDNTTWNDYRYQLMTYMGLAKYQIVYFNIVDSNGNTLRQRVYPLNSGDESYSSINISSDVSFAFQMEKAYFYNVTASSNTYTLTSSDQELFSVVNNGVIPVAPMFTYTPTGAETSIQIQLFYGNYGFTLASTFNAGEPVTFDCGTGEITQNGNVVTGIQTEGSIFLIPPGTVQLYITAGAGTLLTTYNERYI